jgi:hypothetical protein
VHIGEGIPEGNLLRGKSRGPGDWRFFHAISQAESSSLLALDCRVRPMSCFSAGAVLLLAALEPVKLSAYPVRPRPHT